MQGIVNFLVYIRADIIAPIAGALLGIGVGWYIGYKIGWSGLKKLAEKAEKLEVSITTFREPLLGYGLLSIGGLLLAALSSVLVLRFEAAQQWVGSFLDEILNKTSSLNNPIVVFMGAMLAFNCETARRYINRILRRVAAFHRLL